MLATVLALMACVSAPDSQDTRVGDTDTAVDTDTDTGAVCTIAGTYGADVWELVVRDDCTAFLKGFCGEGEIGTPLPAAGGALSSSFTWTWQGAGPSGGSDPATLVGSVAAGVVEGTLSFSTYTSTVYAVLGDPAGTGLGVGYCPLD